MMNDDQAAVRAACAATQVVARQTDQKGLCRFNFSCRRCAWLQFDGWFLSSKLHSTAKGNRSLAQHCAITDFLPKIPTSLLMSIARSGSRDE